MAFFERNKHGHVDIKYYDKEAGKAVRLPRKVYKHLDSEPDEIVQKWLDQWSHENIAKVRAERFLLYETDEALFLFREFIAERTKIKNLSPEYAKDELGRFHNHVLPFFVTEKNTKDVRVWDNYANEFTTWILKNRVETKQLSITHARKVLALLVRFSEFLLRRKVISSLWHILTPSEGFSLDTPLPRMIKPDEMLAFVKTCEDDSIALMALMGYFASLRPSETLALSKSDFYTGEKGIKVSSTQHRFRNFQLGSYLTVYVDKQMSRSPGSIHKKPKTKRSVDYVAIWHKEAAELIKEVVLRLEEGPFFTMHRDTYFRLWRESGAKEKLGNITLHDLRRASALYLGREVEVTIQLLQDHMRHTKLSVTEQYMRKPERTRMQGSEDDWDRVS